MARRHRKGRRHKKHLKMTKSAIASRKYRRRAKARKGHGRRRKHR